MKHITLFVVVVLLASVVLTPSPVRADPDDQACWGQASAVFAQLGEMGYHSSTQPTPRIGLRNLARALYADGVIEDDTLQALGQFVVAELGLDVSACGS